MQLLRNLARPCWGWCSSTSWPLLPGVCRHPDPVFCLEAVQVPDSRAAVLQLLLTLPRALLLPSSASTSVSMFRDVSMASDRLKESIFPENIYLTLKKHYRNEDTYTYSQTLGL